MLQSVFAVSLLFHALKQSWCSERYSMSIDLRSRHHSQNLVRLLVPQQQEHRQKQRRSILARLRSRMAMGTLRKWRQNRAHCRDLESVGGHLWLLACICKDAVNHEGCTGEFLKVRGLQIRTCLASTNEEKIEQNKQIKIRQLTS